MAKAVVASPQALDGIECREGEEVIRAADAAAFADNVCAMLATENGALSAAARRRVVDDYSWESNLHRFQTLLDGTNSRDAGQHDNAAAFKPAADLGGN